MITNFPRPLACMVWLVIAVGLVFFMKESMEVYDGYGQRLDYSIWNLLRVPYDFAPKKLSPGRTNTPTLPLASNAKPAVELPIPRTINTGDSSLDQTHHEAHNRRPPPDPVANRIETIAFYNGAYIRVCIAMPSNFGIRSWRCYEAIIESLAVGIYLYATFVLTSVLFLNADKAIVYSTVMTVCLSAVRVLTTLF